MGCRSDLAQRFAQQAFDVRGPRARAGAGGVAASFVCGAHMGAAVSLRRSSAAPTWTWCDLVAGAALVAKPGEHLAGHCEQEGVITEAAAGLAPQSQHREPRARPRLGVPDCAPQPAKIASSRSLLASMPCSKPERRTWSRTSRDSYFMD